MSSETPQLNGKDQQQSQPQTPVLGAESGEEWAEPDAPENTLFTIFVVMPNEEVCTMRNLPSGIAVFDLKGRLELVSGIPCHLYALMYPDGEELPDHQRLLTQENIRDGYLLRMQLYDNWDSLYVGISKNNIEHVFHSGGVHLKGNIVISQDESEKFDGVVKERATVALYMSSFLGLTRMVNMLLSVGIDVNGSTPFGRTPLHAAVSRDNAGILDLLLNFGASFQQTDCFGVTPLDLAKELSSGVCIKKLRIIQLNLRGMKGKHPQGTRKCLPSNQQGKDGSMNRSVLETRPLTDGDTVGPRSASIRSVSVSRMSDDMSFITKQRGEEPIQKSRKNISSSAPVQESPRTISAHDNRFLSPRGSTHQATMKSRRTVTWKDIPAENDYWEVIEYFPGENNNIHYAVNVKPMKIIHQKKVLKFANDAEIQQMLPSKSGAEGKLKTHYTGTHVRPPQRSKLYKTSRQAVSSEDLRSMRRKIGIAANHGKLEDQPKNTDAFSQWLAKKRDEGVNAEDSDCSDDSLPESEEGTPKLDMFNKWVRKHNRIKNKGLTPGNRFIPGLIQVGSTQAGDGKNPPGDQNIAAHRIWQRNRAFAKTSIRRNTVQDFMSEKRKLEEKRKKLLLTAISYDEWMDNVEERKYLIQQILKADLADMKRLEEEKFKGRLDRYSFDNWKERIKHREAEDRKRREIQKRYEEEQMMLRQAGKSSAAVSFEEWLKRKHAFFHKNKDTAIKSASSKQTSQAEIDSAYERWLLKKHREEMASIEGEIKNERRLLGILTRRSASPVIAS